MLPQMHLFHPEVQKFVLAAECLMFHDVTPQSINQVDLEAIRYYVQCLSNKFASTPCSFVEPRAELYKLQQNR